MLFYTTGSRVEKAKEADEFPCPRGDNPLPSNGAARAPFSPAWADFLLSGRRPRAKFLSNENIISPNNSF